METNDRLKALNWWKNLSENDKQNLSSLHFPKWTFEMVNSSSSKIQQIWELNNKLKNN